MLASSVRRAGGHLSFLAHLPFGPARLQCKVRNMAACRDVADVIRCSEIGSSLIFAQRKTTESISMTQAQLYGSAIVNNTLGLGLFLALCYARQLLWAFNAEALAILVVEAYVGAWGLSRRTFRCWHGLAVLAGYPLALLTIFLLKPVLNPSIS